MDSFLIALNAVIPFFLYLVFGCLVRSVGLVDEPFLKRLNQMIFRCFFPLMMFCNLYSIDPNAHMEPQLILAAVGSVLAVMGTALLLVPRFVREDARRGVVVQALYRSNAVLFMLPLVINVYGEEVRAVTSMALAFVIPLYNVLSVIVLELYRGGRPKPKTLVRNVVTNPMICGAAAGLVFFLLHIHLPAAVYKPLQQFGDLCTPLGMFVLGGTLKPARLRGDLRCLCGTLAVKLLLIPAVVLAAATALGFSPFQRFLLVMFHATPVATASFSMAQNMGGDGDLAGELVVSSTIISIVTLFLWIFLMSSLGLI